MFFELFRHKDKYNLGYFCTPLVWHCNLNCRYCDHFSPISEKKFFNINQLKKDFKEIKKHFNIQSIGLMGGEPLLHPDISDILKMTRKIFPDTYLMLFTNGILLNKQDENFWNVCAENKIIVRITRYPININEQSVLQKAFNHKVRIEWEGVQNSKYKTMHKIALDIEGKQNAKIMYNDCWHRKICCYFEDGKFYRCPTSGNISHFNKYFKKNLELTVNDYLDIYKIKNKEQINKFFSSYADFCRYCNIHEEKGNLPFEVSKKDIKDWCL